MFNVWVNGTDNTFGAWLARGGGLSARRSEAATFDTKEEAFAEARRRGYEDRAEIEPSADEREEC